MLVPPPPPGFAARPEEDEPEDLGYRGSSQALSREDIEEIERFTAIAAFLMTRAGIPLRRAWTLANDWLDKFPGQLPEAVRLDALVETRPMPRPWFLKLLAAPSEAAVESETPARPPGGPSLDRCFGGRSARAEVPPASPASQRSSICGPMSPEREAELLALGTKLAAARGRKGGYANRKHPRPAVGDVFGGTWRVTADLGPGRHGRADLSVAIECTGCGHRREVFEFNLRKMGACQCGAVPVETPKSVAEAKAYVRRLEGRLGAARDALKWAEINDKAARRSKGRKP